MALELWHSMTLLPENIVAPSVCCSFEKYLPAYPCCNAFWLKLPQDELMVGSVCRVAQGVSAGCKDVNKVCPATASGVQRCRSGVSWVDELEALIELWTQVTHDLQQQ